MRTLHKISAYLAVALGVGHLLFTFFAYSKFTHNTLWFIGSGLAIIVAGFLNVVILRSTNPDRISLLLCLTTNLLFAMLFALALTILPEPQVWFGTLLFTILTFVTGWKYLTQQTA